MTTPNAVRTMLAAALSGLMLAGCVPVAQDADMPIMPTLAKQQANPRVALLEHVLASYFTSDITNRPTVCAAVHDGREDDALPPEDEVTLIERFDRLAPLSRCSLTPAGWRDAETEEPALVFSLHSFTCTSEVSCSGWAGYNSGSAASMSYFYKMEWGGAEWAFTRDARALAQ